MSESEGLHAAPNATVPYPGGARRFGLAASRTTRFLWFWTVPIVITLALLGALAPESAAGTELTTEPAATA
jgi:hypothetical protein